MYQRAVRLIANAAGRSGEGVKSETPGPSAAPKNEVTLKRFVLISTHRERGARGVVTEPRGAA